MGTKKTLGITPAAACKGLKWVPEQVLPKKRRKKSGKIQAHVWAVSKVREWGFVVGGCG